MALPDWWDWELELTPHVEKRMEDRLGEHMNFVPLTRCMTPFAFATERFSPPTQ